MKTYLKPTKVTLNFTYLPENLLKNSNNNGKKYYQVTTSFVTKLILVTRSQLDKMCRVFKSKELNLTGLLPMRLLDAITVNQFLHLRLQNQP